MTSIVSICNLALSNIGKTNITSLADASPEARACNQFYAHSRDTVLSIYPWRCAGVTRALAALTNDKPGAWGYAYTRPNDCLKVRYVRPEYSDSDLSFEASSLPEGAAHPYDIDGGLIYCNLSPAFLRFTSRTVDPTKFEPLLVDAMAWRLSVYLAMPLTRDPKIRQDAWQVYLATVEAARVMDANETRSTSDHDSELVATRSRSGYRDPRGERAYSRGY